MMLTSSILSLISIISCSHGYLAGPIRSQRPIIRGGGEGGTVMISITHNIIRFKIVSLLTTSLSHYETLPTPLDPT